MIGRPGEVWSCRPGGHDAVSIHGDRGVSVLVVQRVCVRRDRHVIVQHATLRAPNPGALCVVGTGGAGKSSLLATIAGAGESQGLRWSGTIELDGEPLGRDARRVAWVPQPAALAADQGIGTSLECLLGRDRAGVRRWLCLQGLDEIVPQLDQGASVLLRAQRRELAVLARLAGDAAIFLVDEPTSDLCERQQERIRSRLCELARRACVVVATHNRQDCLALGGLTALLAGGTIQEIAPSARFFAEPGTAAGRTYVDTGNCNLPLEPRLGRTRDGIWWLVPGLLCGMSRPGLSMGLADQLHCLHRHGVRHLVCLEERAACSTAQAREAGMQLHHFPVPDMAPPEFGQAVDLCRAVEGPIRANAGVALHCRGGLGRTGTGLAAILAWFGDDADAAIAKVRRANPLAIQSVAQSRFIHEFADRIRGWHVGGSIKQEMSDVVG